MVRIKIRAIKHNKRPIIANRSLSEKKFLYAILFSGEGSLNKSASEKGQKASP